MTFPLGGRERLGRPLFVFPRDIPQSLLPVSGVLLQKAHLRINVVCGRPSVDDLGAAPIASKFARYTTLQEGIPPAPYINIEHTYQCRGSFIPQLAFPGGGDAPLESDIGNPTKPYDRVDAGKGVVASNVSGTLPVERGSCITLSSSSPLIALNPDGNLHHPIYRRINSQNIKDGGSSEDVDVVATEGIQLDHDISSRTKPNRSTQRDSDGRGEVGQGSSPTLAAPHKSAGEPWANHGNLYGSMDIDSVLRRREDHIKRIPMPDVEWRYGPFD
ncbi:unnamed protein product [Phytomonas sp. Hart1]|nr:unnamed protein product [Phytomonas sp. Hart1]|eukprot:CCW69236.1 unnamed protein product [Phytomonas sp. isolate Hart1]